MSTPMRDAICQREATITMYQQPSGYWHCELSMIVPGLGFCEDSSSTFHDAGECLVWANERMHAYVAQAPGWWPR